MVTNRLLALGCALVQRRVGHVLVFHGLSGIIEDPKVAFIPGGPTLLPSQSLLPSSGAWGMIGQQTAHDRMHWIAGWWIAASLATTRPELENEFLRRAAHLGLVQLRELRLIGQIDASFRKYKPIKPRFDMGHR